MDEPFRLLEILASSNQHEGMAGPPVEMVSVEVDIEKTLQVALQLGYGVMWGSLKATSKGFASGWISQGHHPLYQTSWNLEWVRKIYNKP